MDDLIKEISSSMQEDISSKIMDYQVLSETDDITNGYSDIKINETDYFKKKPFQQVVGKFKIAE